MITKGFIKEQKHLVAVRLDRPYAQRYINLVAILQRKKGDTARKKFRLYGGKLTPGIIAKQMIVYFLENPKAVQELFDLDEPIDLPDKLLPITTKITTKQTNFEPNKAQKKQRFVTFCKLID